MTTMIDLSAGEDGRAREARLAQLATHAISQPLVTHIYTADPSAHVFEGACTSIRRMTSTAGSRSTMRAAISACRITMLRMDTPDSAAVDCGCVLHVRDVAWAWQMWAPDAACRDGRYYLYFRPGCQRSLPHRRGHR